jgi:hypothetical protein
VRVSLAHPPDVNNYYYYYYHQQKKVKKKIVFLVKVDLNSQIMRLLWIEHSALDSTSIFIGQPPRPFNCP